jgi:hypothetical protein
LLPQRGARARAPLPAGEVLGLLRCETLTAREWHALRSARADADADAAAHADADALAAAAARELALSSFCFELQHFNALQAAEATAHNILVADGGGAPSDDAATASAAAAAEAYAPLLVSCHAVGNVLSLLNDGCGWPLPRAEQAAAGAGAGAGADASAFACAFASRSRPNNCAFLEVLVRGAPALAVVTLAPIAEGEELLAAYGGRFWGEVGPRLRSLASMQQRRGRSGSGSKGVRFQPPPPMSRAVCGSGGGVAPGAGGGIASDEASCGGAGSGGGVGFVTAPAQNRIAAPLPPAPAAAAPLLRWVPFGGCDLFKDGSPNAICALAAHIALPHTPHPHPHAHPQPAWALPPSLTLTSLTAGGDVAAALAPAAAAWARAPVLLRPAAGADGDARRRLARLVARLAAAGKAARCDAGGRVAYLAPADGAFARAHTAGVATDVDGDGGNDAATTLFAFVLAPSAPTVAAAAAAPSTHTPAPPHAPPHASFFDECDALPPCSDAAAAGAMDAAMPHAGDDDGSPAAALRAAARAALLAARPRGVLPLHRLQCSIAQPSANPHISAPNAAAAVAALRAALAAAPAAFQLVPQMQNGIYGEAVYLLEADASGGSRDGTRRVAAPPAQAPEDAAYTRRLVAWLRQQGPRWCSAREVVAALPPPGAQEHEVMYRLRVAAAAAPDDVASVDDWRSLAALRDGAAPPVTARAKKTKRARSPA